jgi:hypothetical protein
MTTAEKTRTVTDRPAKATPARRRLSDFACKQVMAVTGIVFGLYVLLHMLGNLTAYLGEVPRAFRTATPLRLGCLKGNGIGAIEEDLFS